MYRFNRWAQIIPFFLVSVFLVIGAQAGDPKDVPEVFKRSFKVKPGGTLFLDVDQGEIEVETRRGDDVLIEIALLVDAEDRSEAKRILEAYRYDFEQQGNDVHVKSRFEKTEGFWNRLRDASRVKVSVSARVPEQYNLDFGTGFGEVTVRDLEGNVRGRTGAGQISVGDISGAVEISTGTGHVEIDGVGRGLLVRTGAGNVYAQNVRGDVDVNTGAGDIEVEIVRQPNRPSNLVTGAGSVRVSLARGIGLDVDAYTGMGSASTDYPLKIESKFVKKSFGGPINGGGPRLHMRAGIGSVELKRM